MATDEGYEGFFGERVASVYDEDAAIFDPAVVAPVVDMLESLAGRGRALEFGIGTGGLRFPLPSAACASSGSTIRTRWSLGCEQSREERTSR